MVDAEQVARQAYAGFAAGDVTAVLNLVDENLEWTFLDPSVPDPQLAAYRGRGLVRPLDSRGSGWMFRAQLEEVVANRDRVLVLIEARPTSTRIRARETSASALWGSLPGVGMG